MDFNITPELRGFKRVYYNWKIYELIGGYDKPKFLARNNDGKRYVCLLKYICNITKVLNEIKQYEKNDNILPIIPILDYIQH